MTPRTDPETIAAAATGALDAVLDAWRARYGHVVADLRVIGGADGVPTLQGTVLVPTQREALVRSIGAQLTAAGVDPADVRVQVEALTERAETGAWLRPSHDSAPVRAAMDGDLATELTRSDAPARRLVEVGDRAVIEMADRTVGWVDAADVVELPVAYAPASVAAWRAGWAGTARVASPAAWSAAVAPWLGVPYRLGGRSRGGIDCSAFVQHVVKEATGLGLPRHSRDQSRYGQRVALGDVSVGDVLFLSHLERGTSHVALVLGLPGAGADVPPGAAHACLDHAVVCVETLDGLLSRYAFRAARRYPAGYQPAP